ncbi:MFS transporter [soil metagenome]
MNKTPAQPRLTAWQVVIGFGLVSLAVDLVADGARSVAGPLLGQLGASALTVSLVTGISEALGYGLRLLAGPAVDRSRRYWAYAIGGYAITGICVPLMAVSPFLGTAGLAVAACLIIFERVGKAVRSPAKTVLLAHAASAVGRGRGFGVHKTLDQVGAFAGPLVVAAIIAATGALWPAFAALALPAVIALILLLWLRRRVPDPSVFEPVDLDAPAAPAASAHPAQPAPQAPARGMKARTGLPVSFLLFCASTALTTFGLVGFGLISFHLSDTNLLALAGVPLVYALGMAAGAVAALATGRIYDKVGAAVLLSVPVLAAGVPALTLAGSLAPVLVGVVLWGAATGIQDSTVKALVADQVATERRGTAYGIFAVFQGAGTFAGAALAGALYPDATLLSFITVPAQVLAIVLLVIVIRRRR